MRQIEGRLEFENAEAAFVRRYFSLDHDLRQVGEEIGRDEHVNAALRAFWGLRLVRQDPWECLISFICATYKSIAAIKQMLLRLSVKFGEKVVLDGHTFSFFPTAERLALASQVDLEGCGLGYRSKYVLETSRRIWRGEFELEALRKMSYEEAKKEICQLPGVGPKVADCVLLFSLDKLDAFPVDVRIKRIMLRYYSEYFPDFVVRRLQKEESFSISDYEVMCRFGRNYFGKYAGYAQEYLYHYERMNH